ncbi:hypothetical protein EPUS_02980 [Endocarpon pusillum Z07020]|uniref:Non-homologous end-joining factor 1 n=1 Tax=Endocarpon pusillum (strain Z07020 / HMAS-L-300199) TaxID=1263415 RepID=U1GJ76_ENDPU|nr:uncharacterized protein EPUS_02980 [Endocarpon pusillum Z07020]ERF72188.1 hypothetical protein EPUS_02980 [Endocarpon pusillum Z07020]
MAPTSMPTWRRLPIADTNEVLSSLLFFTFERDEGGIDLSVTDLVHIWRAVKTSKQELKEEAIKTRCSIDPTEDEEQYEVLLNKLEESISGSHGSQVRLLRHTEHSIPERFEIETSIPLPTPLGTLQWSFRMVRQAPSALTRELVVPALRVIDASRRREEDLRRKIKDKDHVIAKLMDKIEGSGMDLAMVFPGFAGARKALSARQAAQLVPGVKAFRVEEWGADLKDGDDGGLREIVDALKDEGTGKVVWRPPRAAGEGVHDDLPERGWRHTSVTEPKRNQQTSIDQPPFHNNDPDSSESSSGGNIRKLGHRLSSSDSSSAPVRSRNTNPKPRSAKLGTLGGTKSKPLYATKQDSPSPFPEPPAKAPRKSPSTSTDTATESESESAVAAVHSVADRSTATPKKNPAVKMGIIGGRRPPTSSKEPQMPTQSAEPPAPTKQRTPARPRPKLGAIGGKKSRTASLSPAASLSPTVSPGHSAPPPPAVDAKQRATGSSGARRRSSTPPKMEEQPMTEAERADQKRLELKRQLDQRGGAGRKKRRF